MYQNLFPSNDVSGLSGRTSLRRSREKTLTYDNQTLLLAGQIKADGGDQQKFDDGMRALRKTGIQAMSVTS